ncbi:MAG: hypothetical protein WCO67_17915 [Betaproteobacteria bacterium]|jgi:hypothetical protein|nr:hypothetical protein [Betaproteobacteria bacterium]
MGKPFFLRLLLAFALAFSGSAAQLHSLAHAQQDLAFAAGSDGGKAPAPLKHSTEQCLVVHALDGTAVEAGAFLAAEKVSQYVVSRIDVRDGETPALAFQSRAPPLSA